MACGSLFEARAERVVGLMRKRNSDLGVHVREADECNVPSVTIARLRQEILRNNEVIHRHNPR